MSEPNAEWLKSGEYLPAWFRDFHEQKSVFKWIWRSVIARREEQKAKGGLDYLDRMDWIAAHVFVVDHFLWFMARHGWTLQRSRKRVPFGSWDESIRRMKDEEAAAFPAMLDAERTKADAPAAGPGGAG